MIETEDDFLGGRLRLRQPKTGYRVGADSVLLAAAVPARPGERVLDVGTGSGGVAICLAARLPGILVDGLELQPELARFAALNVDLNGLADRVRIVAGDLARAPGDLPRNVYDHVMTNPPYLEGETATAPPEPSKAAAFLSGETDFRTWVRLSLKFVKPFGWLHLVQRMDRLGDLLTALDGRAGDIIIYPLWPKAGQNAKRVIVQARKGGRGPLKLLPGLVLHEADGRYSAAAEAVLRGGQGLPPY